MKKKVVISSGSILAFVIALLIFLFLRDQA
jgi:preprotein translocase subunit SecE